MIEKATAEAGEIAVASPEGLWGGRLQVRSVLCPVDLSEFSRRALLYAVHIAHHFESRLYVQHTFQLPADATRKSAGESLQVEDLPAPLQAEELELRELIEKTGADRCHMTLLLNEGDARERILETIGNRAIDLLVIGTHGRKGLTRLVQGSLTERVIHEAPCPVLVISRPEAIGAHRGKFDPLRLRTILVATDFSPNATRLLIYALRWASETESRVILFHAVETAPRAMERISDLLPEYNPNLERQIREALENMRRLVPAPDRLPCKIAYEVRDGDPREQILRFAKEQRADLILMGARVLGGPVKAWGSIISGVVRDGRFPVLAIRDLGRA